MEVRHLSTPTLSEDLVNTLNAVTRLSYFVFSWAYSISAVVVAFTTLTLPRIVYSVLSWGATFTLRLNFTKVAVTLVIGGTILSYTYKVKYLNRYTTLKEQPLTKDEGFDLHPDLATDQAPSGFHNYLDEFLSAIKVFGYLEKPVFHELARHLQTRRLIAGDSLNLDSDKSFYIVVDGCVQVFAQTGTPDSSRKDAYDDEDDNGYQLLNNVESGGTLSSLFTILSLFTEDVKLRYEEEETSTTDHRLSGGGNRSSARSTLREAKPLDQHRHRRVGSGAHGGSVESKRSRSKSATRQRAWDRDPDVTDFALDGQRQQTPWSNSSHRQSRPTAGPILAGSSPIALTRSPENTVPLIRSRSSASISSSSSTYRDSVGSDSATETESETIGHSDFQATAPTRPTLESIPASGPGTPGSSGLYAPSLDRNDRYYGNGETRSRSQSYVEPSPTREGTIARAQSDTTLAVIPAEAFRRLTKKFPNAAAHIVQVILTRLQRVTFLTAHKYLGLTREVVRTEKAINELACYPLPEAFWESGGIQRLRQRFVPETRMPSTKEEEDEIEEQDYFALDTPYAGPTQNHTSYFEETPEDEAENPGIRLRYRAPTSRRTTTRKAGDLLTTSSAATGEERLPPFSPLATPRIERTPSIAVNDSYKTLNDDFDLRDAVMECISKAIGLIHSTSTPAVSVEASPLVRAHDNNNLQKAVFNSSFGSLSFLGLQGFDDDSSMTGSSIASFSSMDLDNEVEILYFPKDSVLIKEGEKNAGLYFVIEGFLDVAMPEGDSVNSIKKQNSGPTTTTSQANKTPNRRATDSRPPPSGRPIGRQTPLRRPSAYTEKPLPPLGVHEEPNSPSGSTPLFTVKPGGIAGYLSSLSGFPSYVDISAKTECYVGFLPAKALERIMDKKPIVLLTLAKRLISLLSPLVLHIDSALDWMHVSAGQVIYRQGEPADSFYIVINGRLRSINEKVGGGVHINGEYGQGESVGELDCITASCRPSTLHAIRDTELARMPMTLFNAISVRHPRVTIQISRIIASRLRQQAIKSTLPAQISSSDMGKNNFNLKTVAIIPTNRHVPVSEFSTKLLNALESIGATTSYLNQATVMHVLGRHAFSRMGTLKLAGWLAETEQRYRIVLYVADTAVSAPWTQTCIRQADCIFLVADGGGDSSLGEYEKLLVGMKTTARKELVLLHSERNVPPGTTRPWLKNRPWVHAHHHVEMEGATPEIMINSIEDPAPVVALRRIAKRMELQIGKYKQKVPRPSPQRPAAMNDFARLARRLCGKSIGIVLGGGGARGISHIGVLRGLSEKGIPVDMIGGTSIGAFVGGLYAREGDLVSTFGRAKRFSGRMSTLWRILTDLTYPVVAYTTGHEFNRGIYKSFYNLHIEDMWLPFFCNTTNITHSRMEVHTTGYAWRYIRASMSLAGLLPPLCDEGDMLVDGGYVDNLPVSVMLSMGAASVFAIDVGSVDDTSPRNYGESVSGWWLVLQRWNPFSVTPNIPNITEIQSRLTYVSSVKMLEEAKNTPGVLYMRMPVTQFGTMEFKRFDELLQVGSDSASKMLEEFARDGKLPTGTEGEISPEKVKKRGQSIRRNSI